MSGIAQISRSILLFVGPTLILPRLLTPEDFGLVGMALAVIGFVAIFRDLGLSQATVQRDEINHQQISALFWINLLLGLSVALVSASLAPVLVWFYDEPRLFWVTIALSFSAVFGGVAIQHQALLRRQMQYGRLAVIEVTAVAVQIGVAIAMALKGYSYWSLIFGQLAGALCGALGVWIGCQWRPGIPRRTPGVGSMVAFGGNVTGFNIVNYFARNLDDILIGRTAGSFSLGLYRKAYDILRLPLQQINRPISRVALPALSRLVDQPERYRRAYLRILEKTLLFTIPFAVFFMTTSDWLVPLVLGERWAGASVLLAAMAPLMFTQPLGSTTGWLFMSQDRTGDMLRWGVVGASIAVISFFVGLPWGPFGVAAAYSIAGVFIRLPVLLWWVGRKGPVSTGDIYRTAAPFAVAGLASTLLVMDVRYFWDFTPLVGTLVGLLLTVGSMVGMLSLTGAGRGALKDAVHMIKSYREKSGVPVESETP